MKEPSFADRREGGRALAELVSRVAAPSGAGAGAGAASGAGAEDRAGGGAAEGRVVLGLPRGGVPVAYEVATRLEAPLDVLVVRKLGVPGREELAMGALATGGVEVLSQEVITAERVGALELARVRRREEVELARREWAYRGGRPPCAVAGREVVVIDDGLATGATMLAAVRSLRARGARRIVVAAPVASAQAAAMLAVEADEVIAVHRPAGFQALSLWYRDFRPTPDREVRRLLASAAGRGGA